MGKVSNLNNIPWKKALLRMRIIWFALVVGPCAFMVVVIPQIQHHHNPALKPQPMLPWIHVIVFAVVVPTAFFVRRWIFSRTPWPDGIRPSAYYVGDIVFWAACEGVVYMGLVFAVVNGTLSPTIYPSAAALFLQVITFPTGAGAGVSAGRPAE